MHDVYGIVVKFKLFNSFGYVEGTVTWSVIYSNVVNNLEYTTYFICKNSKVLHVHQMSQSMKHYFELNSVICPYIHTTRKDFMMSNKRQCNPDSLIVQKHLLVWN